MGPFWLLLLIIAVVTTNNTPVTLRVRPVGDHLRPLNSRWSFKGRRPSYDGHCQFWWSLGVSATLLRLFGHREVFGAWSKYLSTTKWSQRGPMQSATSNCRTMVFRGRCKVFVVFSSRWLAATGCWPVADQFQPSGDRWWLVADAFPL